MAMSRRTVVKGALTALVGTLSAACGRQLVRLGPRFEGGGPAGSAGGGRLRARPRPLGPSGSPPASPPVSPAPTPPAPPGVQPLAVAAGREALIYVPSTYRPDRPAPLVVSLHGAGGTARGGLDLLLGVAERESLILVAPRSRRDTWDRILGDYGDDLRLLDQALAQVFDRYVVDPAHLGLAGFSDGASYALSVGLTNGDLFSHVMAFSPGFADPGRRHGSPRVFVSHGTGDGVLPIDSTSRRIVPALRRSGYPVLYREFDGGHVVPPDVVGEAVSWFRGP